MPHPCIALPQRAAHAFGSPTGCRISPGWRCSWGRGRGRPVCRSSRVRTWGTPFSCLQPSIMRGIRFILLILADTVPAATAIRLMRAPAPRSPPAYLDRKCTLPPRFRGVTELKFLPTKCTLLEVYYVMNSLLVHTPCTPQKSISLSSNLPNSIQF